MSGPMITPLSPTFNFDPREISDYITQVLQLMDTQDAYGILAGVHQHGGPTVPTFIFGLPQYNMTEIILPPTPHSLPIWIRDDCILPMNQLETSWAMEPVVEPQILTLEGCSVGIKSMHTIRNVPLFELFSNHKSGSILEAGSFGGFLKNPLTPDVLFGLTAAHSIPGGLIGMPVCSPSTLEVTSRMKRLLRYATFSPPTDQLHIVSEKESEVLDLIDRFQFNHSSPGVKFLDPNNNMQFKTGVLSGSDLGVIVRSHFGTNSRLLYQYDQYLKRCLLPHFGAIVDSRTRIDWAIFTCNLSRYASSASYAYFLF